MSALDTLKAIGEVSIPCDVVVKRDGRVLIVSRTVPSVTIDLIKLIREVEEGRNAPAPTPAFNPDYCVPCDELRAGGCGGSDCYVDALKRKLAAETPRQRGDQPSPHSRRGAPKA